MDLPGKMIQVLRPFEGVFSKYVWEWAKVLLIGAILAPGERPVAAILRVMGLKAEKQFQNYHRVLNRASWSSRAVSRLLLPTGRTGDRHCPVVSPWRPARSHSLGAHS